MLQATASLDGDSLRVHVQSRAKSNQQDPRPADGTGPPGLTELTLQVSEQRRRCQRVLRGPAMLELLNELERLRRLEERASKRRDKNQFVWNARLAAITQINSLAQRLQQKQQQIFELEDRVLFAHYLERPLDVVAISQEATRRQQSFGEAMLDLFLRNDPAPDEIAVLVFGPRRWVRPLVQGLASLLAAEAHCELYGLFPFRPEWDTDNPTGERADFTWSNRVTADERRSSKSICAFRPAVAGPLERGLESAGSWRRAQDGSEGGGAHDESPRGSSRVRATGIRRGLRRESSSAGARIVADRRTGSLPGGDHPSRVGRLRATGQDRASRRCSLDAAPCGIRLRRESFPVDRPRRDLQCPRNVVAG